MADSWYEIVSNSDKLCQGDIIHDLKIPIPPAISESLSDEIKIDIEVNDVIILSQTCDLVNSKLKNVLVAGILPPEEFEKHSSGLKSDITKETIRRGYHHAWFLLDACDDERMKFQFRIVDFKRLFLVSRQYLAAVAIKQDHPRMLVPYRENLAHAFAKFISRVALDKEIPKFEDSGAKTVKLPIQA